MRDDWGTLVGFGGWSRVMALVISDNESRVFVT
jgi:hypothetical protein